MSQDIKGYQVREEIGEGGFGKVFRAYQPLIEREVAIKAILFMQASQNLSGVFRQRHSWLLVWNTPTSYLFTITGETRVGLI